MNNRLSKLRRSSTSMSSLPVLTQSEIARRWQLDPDTVRKILKDHSVPTAPGPWKRPRYSMAEVWSVEGVCVADIGDPTKHEALLEPLLTANDLAQEYRCTPATVRNYVRQDLMKSIRLGISIRFRVDEVSFA